MKKRAETIETKLLLKVLRDRVKVCEGMRDRLQKGSANPVFTHWHARVQQLEEVMKIVKDLSR